jgi:hypothetical protein
LRPSRERVHFAQTWPNPQKNRRYRSFLRPIRTGRREPADRAPQCRRPWR